MGEARKYAQLNFPIVIIIIIFGVTWPASPLPILILNRTSGEKMGEARKYARLNFPIVIIIIIFGVTWQEKMGEARKYARLNFPIVIIIIIFGVTWPASPLPTLILNRTSGDYKKKWVRQENMRD